MSRELSNHMDIVDSRDVIARITELEGDRDTFEPTETAATWADEDPDEAAELAVLLALQEEAEGYAADWHHGEPLIRDSYFEEYAQELAEDIGAVNKNATWPNTCIDWTEAAEQLQQDYTSVDWDGVIYWIRS
jgi:hypothetical protein